MFLAAQAFEMQRMPDYNQLLFRVLRERACAGHSSRALCQSLMSQPMDADPLAIYTWLVYWATSANPAPDSSLKLSASTGLLEEAFPVFMLYRATVCRYSTCRSYFRRPFMILNLKALDVIIGLPWDYFRIIMMKDMVLNAVFYNDKSLEWVYRKILSHVSLCHT